MKNKINFKKSYIITFIIVFSVLSICNHFSYETVEEKENENYKCIKTDSYDIYNINENEVNRMLTDIVISENADVDYNRSDWQYSNAYIFTSKYDGDKIGLRDWVLEDYTDFKIDINNEDINYIDPYTGNEYDDKQDLEYDHIIPIHYVAMHTDWTDDQKKDFYYDLDNGVDVSISANRSKSDKGPSEWLPEENQEWYCYMWLKIATDNNISITYADYETIKDILD